MAAPPKSPKVELRSRTGGGYNRAGHRWTGDWQEVPAEILRDESRVKALQADPHLDVRINGRRQPKFAGDTGGETGTEAEISRLKQRISELENAGRTPSTTNAPPLPATQPAPPSEPAPAPTKQPKGTP